MAFTRELFLVTLVVLSQLLGRDAAGTPDLSPSKFIDPQFLAKSYPQIQFGFTILLLPDSQVVIDGVSSSFCLAHLIDGVLKVGFDCAGRKQDFLVDRSLQEKLPLDQAPENKWS